MKKYLEKVYNHFGHMDNRYFKFLKWYLIIIFSWSVIQIHFVIFADDWWYGVTKLLEPWYLRGFGTAMYFLVAFGVLLLVSCYKVNNLERAEKREEMIKLLSGENSEEDKYNPSLRSIIENKRKSQ